MSQHSRPPANNELYKSLVLNFWSTSADGGQTVLKIRQFSASQEL